MKTKQKFSVLSVFAEKNAFSLIEIFVVIGIIGILSAVVLVSMSSYRKNANVTKAISSLSSAIPSMQSCWTFGGKVTVPSNGGLICEGRDSYGNWPDIAGYSFYEISYGYDPSLNTKKTASQPRNNMLSWFAPTANAVTLGFAKTDWFFSYYNGTDQKKVCCNQKMMACKEIPYGSSCNNSTN
jgi:prepilin-type N-terminal cleavage/methylation domain-containing protein